MCIIFKRRCIYGITMSTWLVSLWRVEGTGEDFYQLSEPRLLICVRMYVLIRKTLTPICKKKKSPAGKRMSCLRCFYVFPRFRNETFLPLSFSSFLAWDTSKGLAKNFDPPRFFICLAIIIFFFFFFPGEISGNELDTVSSFVVTR